MLGVEWFAVEKCCVLSKCGFKSRILRCGEGFFNKNVFIVKLLKSRVGNIEFGKYLASVHLKVCG